MSIYLVHYFFKIMSLSVKYIIAGTLCSFTLVLINGEMDFTYYSAADLYRLIQTEKKVSNKVAEVVKTLDSFLEELKWYQESAINFSSENVLKNPLLSYQLVKRHGRDLESLDNSFDELILKISELNESYKSFRTTFTMPSESDLNNAIEAIIRLRQTYNLSVSELSQGKVGEQRIEGLLSLADLVNIGMFAKTSGMNANAKLFFEASLEEIEKRNGDLFLDSHQKSELIEKVQNELKSIPEGPKSDREDFRVLTEMDAIFATDSLEKLNSAFENLCQIHHVKKPTTSNLKCYLDKKSHPVRKILPLRIEVYHEEPQIIVIYNVLSDSEIFGIESATFYKLKRSLTQFYLGGSLQAERSIIRTTSQTWIHDLGHPQFGYLSKRIESITGYYLSGKYSAEELQVASYRPGGHYSLHTDATQEELLKPFLKPEDLIQGDRLVTFMIYLSDVEMGGNTVFPMLNVSVKPVKGSAILWGNMYPDGSIARNTLHGACPVIHGIKNIATKWIRSNDQMFTRHKCKPDKSSKHFNLIE